MLTRREALFACAGGGLVATYALAQSQPLNVGPGNFTYYVDADAGDDSHSGRSPAAPWRSLAKVNATPLQPGEGVGFKRGCVFYGTLNVPSSGTPGRPVIYGAWGSSGNLPQFNGSKQVWNWVETKPGSHIWTTPWWDNPCGVVFVNGSFGSELSSATALRAPGDWYYDANALKLWVSSSATPVVYAGWEDHGITIDGKSYVVVDSIAVQQYLGRGIRILGGGCGRQIQRCWIEWNGDMGMLHDTIPGAANDLVYGNTIRFNQEGGLHLHSAYAGNIEITQNTIYDNVNRTSLQGDQIRAVLITTGLKIHHNYIRKPLPTPKQGNNESIDLANSCNDAEVHHNTIIGILCCKNGTQRVKIYNNTIYTQPADLVGAYFHGGSTGSTIKNNLIWVTTPGGCSLYFEPGTEWGTESDYNLLYCPAGTAANWTNKRWSFSEWTQRVKQDLHSVSANPLVVNQAGLDFSLRPGSPCLHAGITLPGFSELSNGLRPNIGAL